MHGKELVPEYIEVCWSIVDPLCAARMK